MTATLLQVRDLTVSFGGFHAVDHLDLDVAAGELRFLIGPNGAGKTTLIDAITGRVRAATGTVRLAGTDLGRLAEHKIVGLGVGRSFQTPTVFDELSVFDNVDLAAGLHRSWQALARRRASVVPEVATTLGTVGLADLSAHQAGTLSHGQRQWLEIAMLLVQDPKLLLLDEPVAGMTQEERQRTGELLEELAEQRTVVVVEHDMDFLRRFARRVTVMHEGRILCEGSVDDVQADADVQAVYLGRQHAEGDERVGTVGSRGTGKRN